MSVHTVLLPKVKWKGCLFACKTKHPPVYPSILPKQPTSFLIRLYIFPKCMNSGSYIPSHTKNYVAYVNLEYVYHLPCSPKPKYFYPFCSDQKQRATFHFFSYFHVTGISLWCYCCRASSAMGFLLVELMLCCLFSSVLLAELGVLHQWRWHFSLKYF